MRLNADDQALLVALNDECAGPKAVATLAKLVIRTRKTPQIIEQAARKLANMVFAVSSLPYSQLEYLVFIPLTGGIGLSDAGRNYLRASGLVALPVPAAGRSRRSPFSMPVG